MRPQGIAIFRKDQTMSLISLGTRLFVLLVAGSFLLGDAKGQAPTGNLVLGLIHYETVAVDTDGGHLTPWVIVTTSDRDGNVRSYGRSDAVGLLLQPVPPGEYCYEAFSDTGQRLQMVRPANERCFDVPARQDIVQDTVEVGVEFTK